MITIKSTLGNCPQNTRVTATYVCGEGEYNEFSCADAVEALIAALSAETFSLSSIRDGLQRGLDLVENMMDQTTLALWHQEKTSPWWCWTQTNFSKYNAGGEQLTTVPAALGRR